MSANLINNTFYEAAALFALQFLAFAIAKFVNNDRKFIDDKYDTLLSSLINITIISELFVGIILSMYLFMTLGYGIKLSSSFINEFLIAIKLIVPVGIILSTIASVIVFSVSDKTRIKIEEAISCLK